MKTCDSNPDHEGKIFATIYELISKAQQPTLTNIKQEMAKKFGDESPKKSDLTTALEELERIGYLSSGPIETGSGQMSYVSLPTAVGEGKCEKAHDHYYK